MLCTVESLPQADIRCGSVVEAGDLSIVLPRVSSMCNVQFQYRGQLYHRTEALMHCHRGRPPANVSTVLSGGIGVVTRRSITLHETGKERIGATNAVNTYYARRTHIPIAIPHSNRPIPATSGPMTATFVAVACVIKLTTAMRSRDR